MAKTRGLIQRNGVWHVQKVIGGRRVRQSLKTRDVAEASQLVGVWKPKHERRSKLKSLVQPSDNT